MANLYVLDLVKVMVTPTGNATRTGIELGGAYTLPFVVYREWSGNAGYYFEQIQVTQGGEVAFSTKPKQIFVRGLQSTTAYTDTISERIRLNPGPCRVEFHIGGILMAYTEIDAFSLSPTGA